MSQVITNAFEQYWQSSLAAEQPVVLDEFILADIPNLDITAPIDPDTVLPPESQIVHRQNVDQRGRINSNAVAYSIVMDTTVGDFSFNAMFLRNKANGVIGMIVYKGRETKLKTDQTTGQTGNSLVKSMLMGYDQAAEATLTNVDAGTWQIDYAARLRGQDEDLRQLASQLYGHHTFIGDGFKVVQQAGGHQVTPGVAIVGGLRIELKQPQVIYPGTKPIGVWVDVHRSGSLLSEHQNHVTIITSVADLTDHVDGNGYQHYVAKLGTVQADSTVIDGRGQDGSGGSGAIPDTFALWKRSMAEAGYDLIGQFGTKIIIQNAKQAVLSKDGTKVYQWQGGLPKDVSADATIENTGGIGPGAWSDQSGAMLRTQLPVTVTDPRYAGGAKSDGATLNDAAFLAAEADAGAAPIYVPAGTYRLSNPMIHGYTAKYYGPGVLKYDNAETWRRGGSSGSVSAPELYTLLFDFDNQSDISITYDGIIQTITWIDARTVQAPGSTTSTAVRINTANGRIPLSNTPESIRSYNAFTGSGAPRIAPSLPDVTSNSQGMNNAGFGPRCLMDIISGSNNTAGGSRALMSLISGENNTGFGFQALYRTNGTGNTAVGSIAGEHLTTGNDNTLMGLAAGGGISTGSGNTALGYEALNEAKITSYSVAIGYRSLANGGDGDTSQSVAVGAFSQDFGKGKSNTSVGYRSLNGDGGELTGSDNTAQGAFAARHLHTGVGNVAFGSMALMTETSAGELCAMGYQSLMNNLGGIRNSGIGAYTLQTNASGNDNTAFGWSGQKTATGNQNTSVGSRSQEAATTGDNNTTVGFEAGRNRSTGSANTLVGTRAGREIGANIDNTALGSDTLQFLTLGANNTALGRSALRLMQDTTNAATLTNSTGVGANARVSGNNQVQLGDSTTTTYVYGTVQNRSDERDKAELRPTTLGDEFIDGLEAEEGFWDMRDDYLEEHQVQVGIDLETAEPIFETRFRQLPKDGSKKRNRRHQWFRAQKIKALCEKLGIDFGGFQDHTVNGGCDVMSLGYDEFIPPLTAYVQRRKTELRALEKLVTAQQKAIESLTEKLSALEMK